MQGEKDRNLYVGPPQEVSTETMMMTIPNTWDKREKMFQLKIDALEKELELVKFQNAQLRLMSDRDPLTRAYNRRYLKKTAKKIIANALRAKRSWGVLMIDIDHFKRCNDNYGHQCGDKVLQNVAKMLQHISRDADFVVRYGGEEFCVIVFDVEEDNLQMLAERCKEVIASIVTEWEGKNIRVTASIGACFVPNDSSMELEHVIGYADNAMYRAKDQGRDCVVVSDRRKSNRERRNTESVTPNS